MIRRTTWILLALFFILLAATWLWQRQADTPDEAEPTSTPMVMLFDIQSEQIEEIRIESADGQRITIAREGSSWFTTEPDQHDLDEQSMVSKLSQLVFLRALNTFDTPPAADQLGLDHPAYTITVTDDADEEYVLEVGAETPTQSGYYVRLADQVYVVSRVNIDDLLNLLENPPFVTATPTSTLESQLSVTETPAATITPLMAPSSTP